MTVPGGPPNEKGAGDGALLRFGGSWRTLVDRPHSRNGSNGWGLAVGGDVEQALAGIPVPSYVLDTDGVVRWINPAAERLLGNVRGRHFTSIVGPEDRARRFGITSAICCEFSE